MTGLRFNFIKRVLIIPIIITIGAIAAISVVVPKMAALTQTASTSVETIDSSNYALVDYNNFDELEAGNYIGTISSEALDINAAITYSLESSKSSVFLNELSTEPWKNGCIILNGSNTVMQFKNLHSAVIGDEVEIDFYSNDSYRYKISDIVYGNTKKDIASFKKANTLVMCLPYNNFDDLGNSYYYAVYVAERV